MPVIQELADFIAEADLEIGEGLRESLRHALIDTLGCILLGAPEPVAAKTRASLADWGTGQAMVFGSGLKLAAPWAAMANAVAGHALDFDDWELLGNSHSSVVIFPALMALLQERAQAGPRSGREICEAYAVGFEVIARLGLAMNFDHYDRGWHSTATFGPIGAAAAAARLLGLDPGRTTHALSLAVSQAVGYTCQFGANAKPLQAGFAAKAGLMAARLAEKGLTGQPQVLEGPTGFRALASDCDEARFAAAFAGLGAPLALQTHGLVFKAYPSCGYTHRLVDCAIALRREADFELSDIEAITASLPDFHAAILPFHMPNDRREALFSVPYCVATALARGGLSFEDFHGAPWEAPLRQRLIESVRLEIRNPKNPGLNYDSADPDWLEVALRDGRLLRKTCAFPLGAPQNPMSRERILAKFEANAGSNRGLEALQTWPEAADVAALLAVFGDPR